MPDLVDVLVQASAECNRDRLNSVAALLNILDGKVSTAYVNTVRTGSGQTWSVSGRAGLLRGYADGGAIGNAQLTACLVMDRGRSDLTGVDLGGVSTPRRGPPTWSRWSTTGSTRTSPRPRHRQEGLMWVRGHCLVREHGRILSARQGTYRLLARQAATLLACWWVVLVLARVALVVRADSAVTAALATVWTAVVAVGLVRTLRRFDDLLR